MKKILLDTNVVLDVLLERQPHAAASLNVWAAVETGKLEGLLAAHAVTTIHYLVGKELGITKANKCIGMILNVFGVAPVDARVIREALQLPSADFEHAVTAAAARIAGGDFVVTRDNKGFRGSLVPAIIPEAVMPLLS
ncbi:MAG: PIN domain-containing protein [Bryobacteraceae bacterium]